MSLELRDEDVPAVLDSAVRMQTIGEAAAERVKGIEDKERSISRGQLHALLDVQVPNGGGSGPVRAGRRSKRMAA